MLSTESKVEVMNLDQQLFKKCIMALQYIHKTLDDWVVFSGFSIHMNQNLRIVHIA